MVDVHDRPRQLLIRTEREDGDRVRVTVRDAGVGLDRQTMDKLFDAFYTTKSDGMGIGLSVSRSIIEDIMAVSGRSRTMDRVPPSRFPFPAAQTASPTRPSEEDTVARGWRTIPRSYGPSPAVWRMLCRGHGSLMRTLGDG